MKRSSKLFIWALAALSALVLTALVFVNYRGKSGVTEADVAGTPAPAEEDAGIRMDDVHYTSTSDGRIEWELFAKSATHFADRDLLVLDAVEFIFYSDDGKAYTLKAEKGNFREKEGRVDVSGNVEVYSIDGERLRTESLTYFVEEKEIASPDRVEIFSRSLVVSGTGLKGDLDGGKFSLLRDVKAVITDGAA